MFGVSGNAWVSRQRPLLLLIGYAVFPFRRSVKEVAGVELKPRLIRKNGHHASAAGFIQLGDFAHIAGAAFQDPVVIVALAERQLLIRIVDVRSDRHGGAEIHRRVRHALQSVRSG